MNEKTVISNLRKSIFYLQQAIRNDYKDDIELLKALDILVKKELGDDNDEKCKHLNTEKVGVFKDIWCKDCGEYLKSGM